jgi:hypothetical protein
MARPFRFVVTLALLSATSSAAMAWGGAGYDGGSSGGIPGTGEWSYDLNEPPRLLCAHNVSFYSHNWVVCRDTHYRGILPEDRQFPSWSSPDTMLR